MTPALVDAALDGAALAYFDGRLTEAALLLARAARARGVPVLVEGERLRPGLGELLAEADYVVTSAHFPQEWTGEAALGDALLEALARLPNARLLVTTRGKRGSVLLRRAAAGEAAAVGGQRQAEEAESLEAVIARLEQQLAASSSGSSGSSGSSSSSSGPVSSSSGPVDCVSSSGVELRRAPVAGTGGAVRLAFSAARAPPAAAAARAGAAAAAEAARNADAGAGSRYQAAAAAASTATAAAAVADTHNAPPIAAEVLVAPAAALDQSLVADTTGAGDSFIGSVIYGLTAGLPLDRTLQLAAVVAACKCTALGARPGLPRRAQLSRGILEGA